jgi:hypothetical protein
MKKMKTLKAIIVITLAMLTTALADRYAYITFLNGHVTEMTYDKYVQPEPVYTYYINGVPVQPDTVPIGSMPSTPLFDNMKLIRLGHTKAQVSAYVGQPVRVTRTINADGIMDVWFYDDQSQS